MTESKELRLVAFERTSAKDMLEKLRREIARIESTSEPVTAQDHITNAFWTAWHFHKWVWDTISERPALKLAVLRYRGIDEDGIDDHRTFGAALAQRFVPLKICRLIATSSRLVEIELPLGNGLSTVLPAGNEIESNVGGEVEALSGLPSNITTLAPMLVVMGKTIIVTRILNEVENYWITTIRECGVEPLK